MSQRVSLTKTFRFDAAHFLPRLPDTHKCKRLHGHSFEVDITVEGEIDPGAGWLIDYGDLKHAVKPVLDPLDHSFLNEIEGLENPTSEVLAVWIWERVQPRLPLLERVTVHETCTTRCEYEGPSR